MIRAGAMAEGRSGAPAFTLTLAQADRQLRRRVLRTDQGAELLIDLAEARGLRSGDRLLLDDGRTVEVRAAAEPLAEVKGRDALHLARLAWHIGNRHVAAAIEGRRILIRRDHVIEAMLIGLGARVSPIEAPFEPEGGAYAHGH